MIMMIRHLRHALRLMRRSPGFAAVAVVTLGLGLGGAIAIFTVLHAVALEPLPYADADRLVAVETAWPGLDAESRLALSPGQYFYYREHGRTLEEIGVYRSVTLTLAGAEGPAERVQVAQATASVLDVLGARPAVGRLITEEDDRPVPGTSNVLPGPAQAVALMSHDFWVRRYGADPGVVGRTVTVSGGPVPVIGVLEPGFEPPGEDVDLWMPMGLNASAPATNWHGFAAVARMADGATVEGAHADLARFTETFPEVMPTAYDEAFLRETGFRVEVLPLRERVVRDFDTTLWILLAAVGLVLLIACANVANLFLVRTEGRRRELAIRAALGAGRGRLAAQFLAEGVLVALVAGAAGTLLAWTGVEALLATAPGGLPRLDAVALGPEALAFAAALSVATGLAVGAFPLLRFGSAPSVGALAEGGRSGTAGPRRAATGRLLVVGQVALALVLLAGAALLLRSFERLRAVDPGLDARDVLAVDLTLPFARYGSHEAPSVYYERLTRRVGALPGVRTASVTTDLPLRGRSGACGASVFLEDRPPEPDENPPCAAVPRVGPGYFEAMDIPVRGRAPGWRDVQEQRGEVVVSEALARRLWPGEDAIGKGIRGNGWGEPFYRVVGVAADVRADGLDRPPVEAVYFPVLMIEGARGWGPTSSATLVVETTAPEPSRVAAAVRGAITELDPQVPIGEVRIMEGVVADSVSRVSFIMLLLGIAAAVALVLGAVGLYGVVSHVVGRRTGEIGIRMALGARGGQVAGGVVRQTLALALAGIAVGLLVALAATRVLSSLLFEVSPTDPATLAAAAGLLVLVALAAAWIPARRAARVDPMVALRAE